MDNPQIKKTKFLKTMSRPKKMSLISNLLNRIDEKSLAVKIQPNFIVLYWAKTNEKHLQANKELLSLLSYEEIECLFVNDATKLILNDYAIDYSKIVFNKYVKLETTKKEAILVSSYKTIDKIGTSKGEQEIFTKKKTK